MPFSDKFISKQVTILALLSMVYLLVMLVSALLTYKVIVFGPTVTLAGVFMVPVMFSISDVIAELYGYKIATVIVQSAFFCQLLFALLCHFFSHLRSPSFWHDSQAYQIVLCPLLKIALFSFFAYIVSSMLNIYLISKWKRLLKGKLFWLRSIGSSTIGELIFTILAVITMQYGKLSWSLMGDIILSSYTIKVVFSIICTGPASVVVLLIKGNMEKIKFQTIEQPIKPFVVKN